MNFNLPKNTLVDKFIPKNKFFSKTILNSKIKDDFTNQIKKITWKYKLSPETISVNKTSKVEEIQIFEIELKNKTTPNNILQVIDRLIPYPILYIFTYENDFKYWINLKNDLVKKYYFSEWNHELDFNFVDTNLEKVYVNLIKKFITKVDTNENDFIKIVDTDNKINILNNEIKTIKNKIKSEKQFNKKVDLNKILQEKQNKLNSLINN